MMKKIYLILLIISSTISAQYNIQWVYIGEGTYENGFVYPYKVALSVPYGQRDIEDIKEGLVAMKFSLQWLPNSYSIENVQALFLSQLEKSYTSQEGYKLSKNLIHYFLNKLPATKRHDVWEFIYYPDEGTRLFIDNKNIHHLVGAEFNLSLIRSWIDTNPVLTSALFNRLLKLKSTSQ